MPSRSISGVRECIERRETDAIIAAQILQECSGSRSQFVLLRGLPTSAASGFEDYAASWENRDVLILRSPEYLTPLRCFHVPMEPAILQHEQRTVANPETCVSADWARRAETQRLDAYLSSIQNSGLIATETANLARKAWDALSSATGNAISTPDACPGDGGELLLTWDRGDHHLELEFMQGEMPIFFYCHRRGERRSWESEWDVGTKVEQQILRAARFFFTA